MDKLLETTSSLLSKLTSYTGIAVEPRIVKVRKFIKWKLIHIDEYFVMAVIIMKDRRVKTKKIHLLNPLSREEVSKIAKELNERNSI